MPSYSRGDVVLVRYPFTDLGGAKFRPAVIVSGKHESADLIFVPLTSRVHKMLSGEFVLADYRGAGLNVPTAVKRGLHSLESRFVIQPVGRMTPIDLAELDRALAYWLDLRLGP